MGFDRLIEKYTPVGLAGSPQNKASGPPWQAGAMHHEVAAPVGQDGAMQFETAAPVGQDGAMQFETVAPVGQSERILRSWKDSEPLVALSEMLKEYSWFECRLVEWKGRPTLHFEPGLDPGQTERWEFAVAVMDLIEVARDDIEYLWQRGLLKLAPRWSCR